MSEIDLRSTLFVALFLNSLLAFSVEGNDLSIEYISNNGQWEGNFKYRAEVENGFIYLCDNEITFKIFNASQLEELHHQFHEHTTTKKAGEPVILEGFAFNLKFLNSKKDAQLIPLQEFGHYYNYFIGNDEQKWVTELHPHNGVVYKNLYKEIDLKIYSQGKQFKYDFIVAPHGNVNDISFSYEGVKNLKILDGSLVFSIGFKELKELKPYAYQFINGEQVEVPCTYRLEGNKVSFELPHGYDKNFPLVIDPVLQISTYSNSTFTVWGCTATYDDSGNLYTAGACFESGIAGYPTTPGAFQINHAGGNTDVAISKYDPTGSTLIYATYLGGSTGIFLAYDLPQSMMVNSNNELVVMGYTGSTNFPTANAYDNTHNGEWDIFVTVLNPGGTALIGSTYIGGSGYDGSSWIYYNQTSDGSRSEIILDAANNIYVGTSTSSSNFPVSAGAFQSALNGSSDGVVIKLSPNTSTLIWSTYLGGPGVDAIYSIRLDNNNAPYVVGGTDSTGFPTTSGAHTTTYQGGINDGFIAHLNNTGTGLISSTLSGTNTYDQVFMVDIDNSGNIWVMGQSEAQYPISPGVYSNANGNIFIQKLDSALSNVLLSTNIGGGVTNIPEIVPTAFMVDECGNIYLSGYKDWATQQPLALTTNAFQSIAHNNDFYFASYGPDMSSLTFATYLGSTSFDHVDAGPSRIDPNGIIYQAVCSPSNNFPVTPNAYCTSSQNGSYDAIGVKIDFQQAGGVSADISASVLSGCAPLNVNFINNSSNTGQHLWDFGDGMQDTVAAPTHTFALPGIYQVYYTISDTTACNGADTAALTIEVLEEVTANFAVQDICSYDQILLNNNSDNADNYFWEFGDGDTSNVYEPVHYYGTSGQYTITLVAYNSNSCNIADTFSANVNVNDAPVAGFDIIPSDSIELGNSIQLIDLSSNAASYFWEFGDGSNSISVEPEHIFSNEGIYIICQVVTSQEGCVDTLCKSILIISPAVDNILEIPTAFSPNNDGSNDLFLINGYGISAIKIMIFNRWGEKVFETTDITNGWDGSYKNIPQELGAYMYYITGTLQVGDIFEKKGSIILLR